MRLNKYLAGTLVQLICLSCLYTSALAKETRINLTDLALFEPGTLTIHQVDENYLLSARLAEPVIAIVNPEGKLLHRYDKAGQGPGELHVQSVLLINKDSIYIYSKSSGILVFDHQLTLQDETSNISRLAPEVSMFRTPAKTISDTEFVIYANPLQDQHLIYFNLRDAKKQGPWEPTHTAIPKTYANRGIFDKETGNFFDDTFFSYRGEIRKDRPKYTVFAYKQLKGKWRIVAELINNAEDLRPWVGPLLGGINQVLKHDNGYVVEIGGAREHAKSHMDMVMHYDFFNASGHFQRRVTRDQPSLLVVRETGEILTISNKGDDDILVPFSFDF